MSSQRYYNGSSAAYSQQQYSSPQQSYQFELSMNHSQQPQQYGASQTSYHNAPQEHTQYEEPLLNASNTLLSQLPVRSFKDYLRTLPMFPLLTEHEAKAKQKATVAATDLYSSVQPEPQLTGFQKLTMHLMDATTGGVMNVKKYENGLVKVAAGGMANLAADGNSVTLTRWAYVPDDTGKDTTGLVLVDVLQCRRSKSVAMGLNLNSAYVKAATAGSEAVTLTVLGKNVKIKDNKMWTKHMTSKDVNEVVLGSHVQMEPLMTVQVTMSIAEFGEAVKRFDHGWRVPRF